MCDKQEVPSWPENDLDSTVVAALECEYFIVAPPPHRAPPWIGSLCLFSGPSLWLLLKTRLHPQREETRAIHDGGGGGELKAAASQMYSSLIHLFGRTRFFLLCSLHRHHRHICRHHRHHRPLGGIRRAAVKKKKKTGKLKGKQR